MASELREGGARDIQPADQRRQMQNKQDSVHTMLEAYEYYSHSGRRHYGRNSNGYLALDG